MRERQSRDKIPPWVIGAGSIAVALTVFFLVRTVDPNAAPTPRSA